ncbi:MAG: branched-chain amino acid ABC transporter permease, partial [Rhodospirillaceae bacterium]|nr:branched-chain amino acid ABC transporter permease [Rhodospirillaceae bacterium]
MKTPLIIAAVLAVLAGLPPFLDLGLQNALVNVLIASLFALAFNLLVGQAGLLSFGHAAYFGVGAFATLHLMRVVEDGLGFPTPLLPLAGALTGLVVGAIAGFFATMRSGVYFALVTLAIAELFHALAPRWQGLFGGEAGLSSMRMPWQGITFGSTLEVYYLA